MYMLLLERDARHSRYYQEGLNDMLGLIVKSPSLELLLRLKPQPGIN